MLCRRLLRPAAAARLCRQPQPAPSPAVTALHTQVRRVTRREVTEFREQLEKPDHVTVSKRRAKMVFCLEDDDLAPLDIVDQPNPYGPRAHDKIELYWLADVVKLARAKHDDEALVANFINYEKPETRQYESQRKIFGMIGIDRWYRNPSSKTVEGKASILQGLRSNLVIFGGKLIASKVTGSIALFADAMHSLADVSNYCYRYYSINRSLKNPDQNHPYGYAPLRHVCADRSFVGLLMVGGGVPILAGLYELSELYHMSPLMPDAVDPTMSALSVGILMLSAVMEYIAMRTAAEELKSIEKVGKKPDIMTAATHLEAKAGVYGIGIGTAGVIATAVTGTPIVEICAATLMGGIVSGVALKLLSTSSSRLLGATLPVDRVTKVIEKLQADDVVVEVYDVKTQVLGTDTVRFKAELHYNAEAITKKRRKIHRLPSQEGTKLFREISSLNTDADAEDWLMKNDAQFLIAFAHETARLRMMVREELKEYSTVHVDLNIW